ncbi:hypothetical protein M2105_002724 [Paenibacillus sp. PastF-1]|nr:hypothetical protein [Paenibacillus sp. PastF-2]MDF9848180.1 hypothetical protein [Paenibacillus sp. PastM-2]MDF9854867.1 hypothetical protein [Paenibacillus sp. PastF-1]MDH6480137.1 hypothetical protein [Paenibacillus sp. PastH-2]MDH6507568.1 hypothetical protein [Paenibacillus sp. PastM-3]
MEKEEQELVAAILEITEEFDSVVTRENNINNIH